MEENKNISQEIKEKLNNNTELETFTSDDDVYFQTPILIDEQLYSDSNEFNEGIEIGMKYAGIYSALTGNGFSVKDANELILTLIAVENNKEVAEINAKATIESVKTKNEMDEENRL